MAIETKNVRIATITPHEVKSRSFYNNILAVLFWKSRKLAFNHQYKGKASNAW